MLFKFFGELFGSLFCGRGNLFSSRLFGSDLFLGLGVGFDGLQAWICLGGLDCFLLTLAALFKAFGFDDFVELLSHEY